MGDGFWQGKRVFVTGHTGFKGSWLSLLLMELGAHVQGYALAPPSNPSLFAAARLDELVASTAGDVRDFDRLKASMHAHATEIVIHMAAQPLVRRSYSAPLETFATNVMGTVHVLECARQIGDVRVVVNVTSDKCYQNIETLSAYQEHHPKGGHDPYSSSKACAELVSEAYRSSFFSNPDNASTGIALATARAGNVIGGGDWAEDRLIPDVVRCCARGESVEIRSPAAIRPWQLVLEPLSGYLLLAERLWTSGAEFAEGWNFGPRDKDERPVRDVVDRITEYWGGAASWHLSGGHHPHEAKYLKLDCTKAATRLGWVPRTDLDTALRWTVDWYKEYFQGADLRALCRRQIQDFLAAEKERPWAHRSVAFAKAS